MSTIEKQIDDYMEVNQKKEGKIKLCSVSLEDVCADHFDEYSDNTLLRGQPTPSTHPIDGVGWVASCPMSSPTHGVGQPNPGVGQPDPGVGQPNPPHWWGKTHPIDGWCLHGQPRMFFSLERYYELTAKWGIVVNIHRNDRVNRHCIEDLDLST